MRNKNFVLSQLQLTDGTVGPSVANSNNTGDEGTGASSGTYIGQKFSCVYVITVTKAGAFGGVGEVTVTCQGPGSVDENISDIVAPTSAVAFNVGTIGVQFTLTDGGNTVLTLGDSWTIDCSGAIRVISSLLVLGGRAGVPRTLSMTNGSGALLGILWIGNGTEWQEYIADESNFDFMEIANGANLSDIYNLAPMSKAYRILVKYISGVLSAGVTIQGIDYSVR